MNSFILRSGLATILAFVSTVASAQQPAPQSGRPPQQGARPQAPTADGTSAAFQGALPAPMGRVRGAVSQLQIKFPESMVKEANKEVFTVTCSPAAAGFSGWADNNTTWTFDFKAESEYETPRLVGGTKCRVQQTAEVKSTSGKSWRPGSIAYDVIVAGPDVVRAVPAAGFQGSLRETDPVILIEFNGPVDQAKFFSEQNGVLNYLSSNAPSEKLPLVAVPDDQAERIFNFFAQNSYSSMKFTDKTWVLATVRRNLIPGSQVRLTVERQTSGANPDVRADRRFAKDFAVRSQFQAEVKCANPSSRSGSCLPRSPITIALNGQVKWADIKDASIEYIPYKSGDGKIVKSFAELDSSRQIGMLDMFIYEVSRYFPFLARFSDIVVDSVVFNVNIEPETQAKVVIPQNLTDVDGRRLSNAMTEFHLRIGAMHEILSTPRQISFFEKNVANPVLPVGVVNLNQVLRIRKTGTDAAKWEPIRDFSGMIRVINAYSARGPMRSSADYTSPLETLGLTSNVVEQKLTGIMNRPTVLQFPFGDAATRASGLYPIEVSSPSLEAARSNAQEEKVLNPKYVLAPVPNLGLHLKHGESRMLVWATHLSTGAPAAGAQIEIYNCRGELKTTAVADAQGLASIPKQTWAESCESQSAEAGYSQFLEKDEFFVGAKKGDDMALIHSSWVSSSGYALAAPGIEYFYSSINEERPNFHAVIGVNLVKPGQQVPVEIHARIPDVRGFRDVSADKLPSKAKIVSSEDSDTFYEFPLTWSNGKAELLWNVPSDSSVKLGSYSIQLVGGGAGAGFVQSSDIEVAEFKIPLMSGLISFPTQDLVRPTSIPVSSVIRYANGVGAKNLKKVSFAYFFSPSSVESESLPNFTFGSGPVSLENENAPQSSTGLPTASRPTTREDLTTGEDGSLVIDVATEQLPDGRTVADVLKESKRPQKIVVRVRYPDQVGEFQTLSQSKTIYNSQTYVGTKLVAGDRSSAKLQAATIDVSSRNVTSIQDLEVSIVRIETRVIGEELFGGLIKNTLERELKPVRWTSGCTLDSGVVSCPVGALREGSYAFQAKSKSSGQQAHSLFKVGSDGRVYGPNDYLGFGDDEGNRQLPLALDKKTYKHGERAVVSFSAPFRNCSALVTVERGDVISSFISTDACARGMVEIPVDASLAPNAFVSVYAVTGRSAQVNPSAVEADLGRPTYRLGFANVLVDWAKFKANVTVQTNKAKYEPGENVDVQVTVRPEEGRLQAATVTLVAIEEKILELKANPTYAVLESLMQMRGHGVRTVTALERIETIMVENGDLADDAERKGGDEGGDGGSASEMRRRLFNALVAFKTNVPVQNGVARASFKTNDSLTRFKVFAIVTDAAHKFGTGETVYLTEKETQSFSNIPSVAHTGDAYPLRVTVQNNGSRETLFRTEIVATIKDRTGRVIDTKTMNRQARIGASASEALEVGRMTIGEDARRIEYVVRIFDEQGRLVDALEPDAQVILPAVPLAVHDSLIAQTVNGNFSKALVKDASALPGQGEIRVTTSNSLVTGAQAQMVSRMERDQFADLFIESRFQRALMRSSETRFDELKAVLDTMVSYTDGQGFLKFSPQSRRGSVALTISVLTSLQQEPWAARLMPPALGAKLKAAISSILTKSAEPVYVGQTKRDWMRAQVVAARAAFLFADDRLLIESAKAINTEIDAELRRSPRAYGEPVDKWSNGDVVEKWLLEVYATPATAVNSAFFRQLTAPTRLTLSGNAAKLKGAPGYSYFYSDETLETAKLLMGLAILKGDARLARQLALGLVSSSTRGWYTSSTMINTLHGLRAFARAYEVRPVTGVSTITIPEENKSGSVDFAQKTSGSFSAEWNAQRATVNVAHAGQGNPWVSVQALQAIPLTQARGQGLNIEKTVRNVNREQGFQAGDIIEVTLTINANNSLEHVAMMDPIPAGANILADAYGSYTSGQKSYSGYKLYFEVLPSGATTVKYQYQLNNPGTFKLPPTRAEGLYLPSVFADAPNSAMTVQ